MNRELIQQLIGVIEYEPEHFDQNSFGVKGKHIEEWVITATCDSPACIAGHVMVLTNNMKPKHWSWFNVSEEVWITDMYYSLEIGATRELGLTYNQGTALFRSEWPRQWVDGIKDPLQLIDVANDKREGVIEPTAEEAVQVLNRLLEYGFSHETFYAYYK